MFSSGLYHLQGSSSSTSALASIYSTQLSNSVASTPLDGDWGVGGLPASTFLPNGYIPYPYSTPLSSNNHPYTTPSLTSGYPSSLNLSSRNLSYYNNLNNNATRRNQNFSSLSSIYEQDYQFLDGDRCRPGSALSSYSASSSLPGHGQSSSSGLCHGTNLTGSTALGPPPAYSFRPIGDVGQPQVTRTLSESFPLFSQSETQPGNNVPSQQQTGFMSTNLNLGENRAPNSQTALNLRQILLQREQQRSRLNHCGNPNRPNRQSGCNHPPLTPQERTNLATIQSLINAYRTNCSHSGPTSSPGNVSLTTADVNRLNAINLLVSNLLKQQNQRQQNQRQQNQRQACGRVPVTSGDGSSAPNNRPLLALLDGVIRASASSPTSGSGGESVSSSSHTETTTSGIGSSVSGNRSSGTEDSNIGPKNKGPATNSGLKMAEIRSKNFTNSDEISKTGLHFENEYTNVVSEQNEEPREEDYDKIGKQKEIIEIIETRSVPLREDDCFDVDELEVGRQESMNKNDQDYVGEESSFEDEERLHNDNLGRNRDEKEQSELSLEANLELNLELGEDESELNSGFDKMDVNLRDTTDRVDGENLV